MRKFFTISDLLFFILLFVLFWPSRNGEIPWRLAALAVGIEAYQLLYRIIRKSNFYRNSASDVVAVVFSLIIAWHVLTSRLGILDGMLFPSPDEIVTLFIIELPDMLKGLVNSLILLVSGYLLALLTAVPAGLFIGWRGRLFRAVNPFAKVIGPIPPIVYIPYAIALLPSFRAASIFVVFMGAFWPIFINTLQGVFTVPRGLIDSAKVLNLRERTLLIRVILPGAMPSICTGATLALLFSFIMLTAAELIGANSGIGWYVKNFADFADYKRVIVGIVFIGVVVSVITFFMEKIEQRLLRWR